MFVFFFQAEDGIRDYKVTGVQTCASSDLVAARVTFPCVCSRQRVMYRRSNSRRSSRKSAVNGTRRPSASSPDSSTRSEERRVGKECRVRWWTDREETKKAETGRVE